MTDDEVLAGVRRVASGSSLPRARSSSICALTAVTWLSSIPRQREGGANSSLPPQRTWSLSTEDGDLRVHAGRDHIDGRRLTANRFERLPSFLISRHGIGDAAVCAHVVVLDDGDVHTGH